MPYNDTGRKMKRHFGQRLGKRTLTALHKAGKRKGDSDDMKAKKRYSVLNNYRYTFQHLHKLQGMSAFAVCIGDMVMSILLPFLEAALAGAVAACLTSSNSPEIILLLVAGYVILLQTARWTQGHLRSVRSEKLLMLRLLMGLEYERKSLEMDGQSRESAAGQEKWMAAQRNIFWGHQLGIEAHATCFWNLMTQSGGFLLYGIIIGKNSLPLLFLLSFQALLSVLFQIPAGRQYRKLDEKVEDIWRKFRYLRQESLAPGNGKDIRLYRMDRWLLRAFGQQIDDIVALTDRQQGGFMAAGIAEKLLSFGVLLLIYGHLLKGMAKGAIALPAFLLYIGIVSGFSAWAGGILSALQEIRQNDSVMDSYRDFMDFGATDDDRKPAPAHPGTIHEIRLEHVCFRYEGSDRDAVHDVSLTIRPGERLALVGQNGAGKTTLIKLICGLYRPTGGRICLDGQDMQTLSRAEIFKEFSVVFQDVFAFSFPLCENVSCCKNGEEDPERLADCLEKAGLTERVKKLPKGVRTAINRDMDEEGVSLSGGELQRLMLARALYKNAPVVILDEPTAALDPLAESDMYEKYDTMLESRTGIFISHRLSSTRFCDRILFLEKGAVTEEGSHESLLGAGKGYAELFHLQARYYQQSDQKEEESHA